MSRNRGGIGPAASSGMIALHGASSVIKSIQRGTIALAGVLSNTAVLTVPVDTANARIVFLGADGNNAGDNIPDFAPRLALTNATTVTATKTSVGGGGTTIVSFEVIEYLPGVFKSIQRGFITLAGVAFNTDTLPITVDPNKASVEYLGCQSATVTTQKEWAYLTLTNGTTVTATRTSALAPASIIGYQVVEYF